MNATERRLATKSRNEEIPVINPTSLLKLCINYVAKHLELVESLVDFPEIIGELIFRAAESNCRFHFHGDEYHDCLNRLKLFTEAYRDTILSKLSLSGRRSSFRLYKDHIQIFTGLTELELFDCGLVDDDELLPHIGQNLHHLTRLSLKQNKLTDKGLVRLTTPYRVLGRGPRYLVYLNISDNFGITRMGILKYFSAFQVLNEINITGTSVKRNEELLKIWTFEIKKGVCDTPEVTSAGWASDVVDLWAAQAEQSLLSADVDKTAAQRFYSKKRKIGDNNIPSSDMKQTVSGYSLILVRVQGQAKDNPVRRGSCRQSRGSERETSRASLLVNKLTDSDHNVSHVKKIKCKIDLDEVHGCRHDTSKKAKTEITKADSEVMQGYLNLVSADSIIDRTYGHRCTSVDEKGEHAEQYSAKRRKMNISGRGVMSIDNKACKLMQNETAIANKETMKLSKVENIQGYQTMNMRKSALDIMDEHQDTTKVVENNMADGDLDIMMGYLGKSDSVAHKTQESPLMVRERQDGQVASTDSKYKRFFDRSEAELMHGCTKSSSKIVNKKKLMWKYLDKSVP